MHTPFLSTLMAATILVIAPAQAAVVSVLTEAALAPNDMVDWTQYGPDGTVLSTPSPFISMGGLGGAVSASSGQLNRADQGTSFLGGFMAGDPLIYVPFGESSPLRSDAVPIRVDSPVLGIGLEFEPLSIASTLRVEAFDVSSLSLGVFTFAGTSGTPLFFGLLSDIANISFIVLQNRPDDPDDTAYQFAFNKLRLVRPAAVPEPATLVLLGFGLLALRRQRR